MLTPSAVLVGCAVSLAAALVLVPALRALAHRFNITDRPDAVLKPHAKPIAYLGGLGFYMAWLAGLIVVRVCWPEAVTRESWLIVLLAGAMMLVGLLDDIWSISPKLRLALETTVAVLLFALGVRFMGVPILEPGGWPAWVAGLAIQLLLVLGACNSTNLLDGLDGLCGGVSAIVLAGFAAIVAGATYLLHRINPTPQLDQVLLLAPTLAAGLVGFLVYNYRPASIFMGDAGSLLLGFAVAGLICLMATPGGVIGMNLSLAGFLAFALPVVDTGLAFFRRAVNRKPIFEGDRSHFYDQLVDRGVSVTSTVKTCYALSVGFVVVGWTGGVLLTWWQAMLLYVALLGALILLIRRMGLVRHQRG